MTIIQFMQVLGRKSSGSCWTNNNNSKNNKQLRRKSCEIFKWFALEAIKWNSKNLFSHKRVLFPSHCNVSSVKNHSNVVFLVYGGINMFQCFQGFIFLLITMSWAFWLYFLYFFVLLLFVISFKFLSIVMCFDVILKIVKYLTT